MKKKIVSALMVAAMVVTAFAGCGSDKGGTSTQGGDKTSKSSGKVYMLNFKPETDEAWQDLAETYTDQTGVEVNVLTALYPLLNAVKTVSFTFTSPGLIVFFQIWLTLESSLCSTGCNKPELIIGSTTSASTASSIISPFGL